MKMSIRSQGLKEANALMVYMASLGATINGCKYSGSARNEGDMDNGQVINDLKKRGRDITTMKSDDQMKAAQAWMNEITLRLGRQKQSIVKSPVARANRHVAAAYRKAGAVLLKIISERAENSVDYEGNTKDVTKGYAAMRSAKYGVANDTSLLFKATGQLLNDVAANPANIARIRLIKGGVGAPEVGGDLNALVDLANKMGASTVAGSLGRIA